ncbi:unnamed protein product [Soboliphyme baturini]|uniref:DUF4200 domain-containing protein n=1 Tax=Soboliphyme baturini TaxID=241478 RepID=A0A183ITX2_9BILA|nr:unnamed protein product [Soboliphyme baturini]
MNSDLTLKFKQLDSKLHLMENEVTVLTNELCESRGERDKFRKQHESAQLEIEKLKFAQIDVFNEKEDYRSKFDELKEFNATLQARTKDLEARLEKSEREAAVLAGHGNHRQKIHYLNNLQDEKWLLIQENVKLKQAVHRLCFVSFNIYYCHAKNKTENSSLNMYLFTLEGYMRRMAETYDALMSENRILCKAVRDLERTAEEKRRRKEKFLVEVEEAVKDCTVYFEDMSWATSYKELWHHYNDLKAKIAEETANLDEKAKYLSDLQSEVRKERRSDLWLKDCTNLATLLLLCDKTRKELDDVVAKCEEVSGQLNNPVSVIFPPSVDGPLFEILTDLRTNRSKEVTY